MSEDKAKKRVPDRSFASIRRARTMAMRRKMKIAKAQEDYEEQGKEWDKDAPLSIEEPSELEQSILNHMDFKKFDKGHL